MIAPLTLHRARGAFALRVARPARPHPVGTVLCLHGFPDTAATFDPLLDALADAGFVAAAPTLRGYRPSPLAGPFDLDTLADDALDLAAALSPDAPRCTSSATTGAPPSPSSPRSATRDASRAS
jgi:pimeloyl-ACP methyl ester carboxylesterase